MTSNTSPMSFLITTDSTPAQIMELVLIDVSKVFEEDPEMIKRTKPRPENLVRCRRIFCYVCGLLINKPSIKVSLFMGARDHTTYLHHSKKVKEFLENNDPKFAIDWAKYTVDSKIWPQVSQKSVNAGRNS